MREKVLLFLLISLFSVGYAQDSNVVWLSFEQTAEKFAQKQKPVLIFAFAEDDSLSQKMFQQTFANPEVAKYINLLFYPVRLNVFDDDTITFFNGNKFVHLPNEKYHSLAKKLLDSVAVPAMIVFDKKAVGRVFYGFKNRDSIFPVLIYYAEEVYNSTDYDDWQELYFSAYPPGLKQIITHLNIHWLTMDEMLEKQKTEPRKILIDIYNNYNVSQTVMRLQVYNDKQIANYLNKNYYPVTLQLRSNEEFTIKGITYKNSGKPLEYHEFAVAVLNKNLRFPAFVILDEDFNLLDRIQIFVTKDKMSDIVHYYGDNVYKTKSFKDYQKQK
jgi:thioredoxin-related protein